jgi:hypothetical protein
VKIAGLTKSQQLAFEWLRERNGDGCFDLHGVLIAAGEKAPFTRTTWNALRDAKLLEFYRLTSKGRGRARLVPRAP